MLVVFRSTIMQLEGMQTTTNCLWPEDQHYLLHKYLPDMYMERHIRQTISTYC